MRVVILGAGIIGVTSAWYLRNAGFDVTVIDRQSEVAKETSHANGGQVSVSQAEPWANPEAIRKIVKWLGREDAPLLFRMRADIGQWLWALRFLRECTHNRHIRHMRSLVSLGLFSRQCLQKLRSRIALNYEQQYLGILQLHSNTRDLESAIETARLMSEWGLERTLVNTHEMCKIEPALASCAQSLLGGIYCPSDESGNAHIFTKQLAAHALEAGVSFAHDCSIRRFNTAGNKIRSVELLQSGHASPHTLTADAFVVALGSYSPLLLAPLGIKIPIFPVKGYSITVHLNNGTQAPFTSLTDESHKLVFSRLGNRLRVAGTAELTGYDTTIRQSRCQAILARTINLFPSLGNASHIDYWSGLRPATPNNMPLIGRHPDWENLYLNTGHGTLGWTLSCGSAAALADLMQARHPDADFPFLASRSF